MGDQRGDRPGDGREGGGDRQGGGRGGPEGSEWLQLEVSRVMYGRAEAFTTEAAEELLREAVKARLRERLGPRLEAIGRLAADRFIADLEASLDIEARITARRDARQGVERLVDEVLGRGAPGGDAPAGEVTGEGWDPRQV
jgi:hypothetical protein